MSCSVSSSVPLYLSLSLGLCPETQFLFCGKLETKRFDRFNCERRISGLREQLKRTREATHARSLPCSVERDCVLHRERRKLLLGVCRRASQCCHGLAVDFLGRITSRTKSIAICDWIKCLTSVNYVGFTCSWPRGLGVVPVVSSLLARTCPRVRVRARSGNFRTKTCSILA